VAQDAQELVFHEVGLLERGDTVPLVSIALTSFLALQILDAPHLAWVGAYGVGGAALAAVYPPGLLDDGNMYDEEAEDGVVPSVIPMGPIADPPTYGPTGLEQALGDRPADEAGTHRPAHPDDFS
jgi:hypothetical protein